MTGGQQSTVLQNAQGSWAARFASRHWKPVLKRTHQADSSPHRSTVQHLRPGILSCHLPFLLSWAPAPHVPLTNTRFCFFARDLATNPSFWAPFWVVHRSRLRPRLFLGQWIYDYFYLVHPSSPLPPRIHTCISSWGRKMCSELDIIKVREGLKEYSFCIKGENNAKRLPTDRRWKQLRSGFNDTIKGLSLGTGWD